MGLSAEAVSRDDLPGGLGCADGECLGDGLVDGGALSDRLVAVGVTIELLEVGDEGGSVGGADPPSGCIESLMAGWKAG